MRYITTDGDSRSAAGVAETMRLLDPMLKVERQADPVHLGQAQFRQCYKAQFSERMFPTSKTREQRQKPPESIKPGHQGQMQHGSKAPVKVTCW